MRETDSEFLREEWSLYGIGVIVLLLRFATRLKTVGIKGFQGDDYMSILTLAFFTMDAATVHIIYFTGTNVEASAVQQTRTLTAEEIKTYTFGSKEQLIAWYSYTALIWTMKATMLFFFHRLTIGLWQHKFIKWLGFICAVSYCAVFLTLTFGCFPTYKNWQVVPDPGIKCTLKLQNFLVTVVLNVITDALILAIPLPLLWGLKITLRRKLIIGLLLCSGLFVIAAAIIRVVLTLGANPSALNINRWGVRETIVGIITINLPILKPLFSSNFWSRGTFKSTNGTGHGRGDGPYEMSGSRKYGGKLDGSYVGKGSGGKKGKDGSLDMGISDESLDRRRKGSFGMESDQDLILQGTSLKEGGVTVLTSVHVMSEDIERGERGGSVGEWSVGGGVNKTVVHARNGSLE